MIIFNNFTNVNNMSYQFIFKNISDINDTLLCRTCLLKNDELQSIFTKDETLVKNYAEMLMEVAPIRVSWFKICLYFKIT